MAIAVFPEPVLEHMARSLGAFAAIWHQETPTKIHNREVDRGGAPQWHPEFARWMMRGGMGNGPRNPEDRLRLTQVMRSLRKVAPRQYEVTYRIMVNGDSVAATTSWLNERAIRGGHPERYRHADTLVMLQSSLDWLEYHY